TRDKFFSRLHFLMEVNPPHCRLVDLGSRNGTYVNGQRVAAADLKNGDQIRAGRTILRVVVRPAQEAPLPPPREPGTAGSRAAAPRPSITSWGSKTRALPAGSRPAWPGCLACSASLASSAGSVEPAPLWENSLLCPVCQDLGRSQPQPITGYHI